MGRLPDDLVAVFPPTPTVGELDGTPAARVMEELRVAVETAEPEADDPADPDDAVELVLVVVVVASSAASVARSCARVASAARRAAVKVVGSCVANVWPSVTCWPTRTLTEVTVPEAGNVTRTLFTG